jgi:hypothetical protein
MNGENLSWIRIWSLPSSLQGFDYLHTILNAFKLKMWYPFLAAKACSRGQRPSPAPPDRRPAFPCLASLNRSASGAAANVNAQHWRRARDVPGPGLSGGFGVRMHHTRPRTSPWPNDTDQSHARRPARTCAAAHDPLPRSRPWGPDSACWAPALRRVIPRTPDTRAVAFHTLAPRVPPVIPACQAASRV